MKEVMLGKVFYSRAGFGNNISRHVVVRETEKSIWINNNTSILKRMISKDGSFSIGTGQWSRSHYYPESDEDNEKYNNQLIKRNFDKWIDEVKLNADYDLMKKIIELIGDNK